MRFNLYLASYFEISLVLLPDKVSLLDAKLFYDELYLILWFPFDQVCLVKRTYNFVDSGLLLSLMKS